MSIAGLYRRSRGDFAGFLKGAGQAWQQYGPQAVQLAQATLGPRKYIGAAKLGLQGIRQELAPGGEWGMEEAFPGRRRRSRGRGITASQLRNYLRVAKLIRKYAPLARGTPRKARRGR